MKFTYDKRRIPVALSGFAFMAGTDLWIQTVVIIFHAGTLVGPVEGPFTSIAWRIFFSGPLLVIGTYVLTKRSDFLLRELHLKI